MTANLLQIEEFKLPQIEIDLENRLNDMTFYPKNYNLEIKNHFEKYIEKTNKVLSILDKMHIRDYLVEELKSYLTKYGNEYVNYLYLKSKNPSWIATGRGNLNVIKYHEGQNSVSKKLSELNILSSSFDKKLDRINWDIKKEHKKIQFLKNQEILNSVKKVPKFTRNTEDIIEGSVKLNVNVYRFNDYKVYKLFGYWRVANELNDILFRSSKLINCKKYIGLLTEGIISDKLSI